MDVGLFLMKKSHVLKDLWAELRWSLLFILGDTETDIVRKLPYREKLFVLQNNGMGFQVCIILHHIRAELFAKLQLSDQSHSSELSQTPTEVILTTQGNQ